MAKKNQHAVIGSGNKDTTATAIKESLLDVLDDGDTLGLVWQKPIPPNVETVYDFVIDQEVPFVMYHTENASPPRVFREASHGSVQKSRDPVQAALQAITGSGKVLFLWDDAENKDDAPQLIEKVFDTIDDSILVLELTGGLAPIKALKEIKDAPKSRYDDEIEELIDRIGEPGEDDEDIAAEIEAAYPDVVPDDPPTDDDVKDMLRSVGRAVPVEEKEEEDLSFSKEELINMPAAAVKRYGARMKTLATTKGGIIEELFPEPVETLAAGVKAPDGWVLVDRSLREIVRDREAKEIQTCYGLAKSLAWGIMNEMPVCRERSLALTRLDECLMWIVQGTLLTSD